LISIELSDVTAYKLQQNNGVVSSMPRLKIRD